MKRKAWILLFVLLILTMLAACKAGISADPNDPGTATGTQTVVIEGFEWGPAVTKTIVTLNRKVQPDSVQPERFTVSEHKETLKGLPLNIHFVGDSERTVTAAYPCDAAGNRVSEASERIALELAYAPSVGSPFCYGLMTSQNTYCDPYELNVSLAKDSTLTDADGNAVTGLAVSNAVDFDRAVYPQLANVDCSGTYTGADGQTLCYASYEPEADGAKHPLVIWLHGAGEGGSDPRIALLGNEVSALFGEEFQSVMGNAYVLCPQTERFWMVYNEKGDWQNNPGTSSVYRETLSALIHSFVSGHDAIDLDRIYVGGCSNGGYMTMDLIVNEPDFYAAAYLISESYKDAGLTDAQLAAVKDLPMWFVYAENDSTVKPKEHEVPTIARLRVIGADVHASVFTDVHDTSGTYTDEKGQPYDYNGHWSWIYFFNNECTENGVNLWQWLAEQTK